MFGHPGGEFFTAVPKICLHRLGAPRSRALSAGLPCLADPQTGQVPSAATLLPSFPLPPSFASKSNTRGSYKLQILPVPTSVYNFSFFNFFFPHHTLVTHFPQHNALPASHLSFQAHCNNYVFLCNHSFCSIVQDPQSRPWFLT